MTKTKTREVGFALGTKYRDTVSNFVGTAIQRIDFMSGEVDLVLSGQVTEKHEIKHHTFSPARLVDMEGNPLKVDKLPKQDITFGNEYRDRITGFVGKATSRVEHINGCIQWALDPGVNEKNEMQTGYYFDDDRIMDPATETKVVAKPAPRGNSNLSPSR